MFEPRRHPFNSVVVIKLVKLVVVCFGPFLPSGYLRLSLKDDGGFVAEVTSVWYFGLLSCFEILTQMGFLIKYKRQYWILLPGPRRWSMVGSLLTVLP